MVLWIFQMLFNLIMAGIAAAWLLSLRRNRRPGLMAPRESLPEVPASVPSLETPLGSPVSTLSERVAPELRTAGSQSPFDAYEKADFLMSRGMDLREIARQTGLSLAELQLIGKMSQKSQ